jgi:hypothetical protein
VDTLAGHQSVPSARAWASGRDRSSPTAHTPLGGDLFGSLDGDHPVHRVQHSPEWVLVIRGRFGVGPQTFTLRHNDGGQMDVPAHASARVREFATGHSRKADATVTHSIAPVANGVTRSCDPTEGSVNLLIGLLVLVAVTGITVTAMLLVRRRAPEGSYFTDGDRASGVFGVLATGFSVLLGFIIFLSFASYDDSRAGAEAEATLVLQ